jgi:hypothetical protein
MRTLGIVNRWFFLHGLPGLRAIPGVRDLPLGRGYFWVRALDMPAADRERLRRAVSRYTVAFLGPNHPEFATDWLIDKELSTDVAPLMASWADRGIIAGAPRFWGMNNLVANDGGDSAKEYSIECALRGDAVLLHPEGTVRWTNDRVHPLFPGIAQMAIKAAERTEKPVYIVPLVWKYRYTRDVSARIDREISIIEAGLSLPATNGLRVPQRFLALQRNVLTARMVHFGLEHATSDGDFFARQQAFQQYLLHSLEQRHLVSDDATDSTDTLDRRIARFARTIRDRLVALRGDPSPGALAQRETLKRDYAIADEAKRLGEFNRETYGGPTLTQEQISESLKRTRDRLLARDWKDTLGKMLPRPLGPRIVHVAVPEPIRVARVEGAESKGYEEILLQLTRKRMQDALDEINARIATSVDRYRCENPFV